LLDAFQAEQQPLELIGGVPDLHFGRHVCHTDVLS
jgi:hypothetical protein